MLVCLHARVQTQMCARSTWSCCLIIFSPVPWVVLLPADEWKTAAVLFHFTSLSSVEIMVNLRTSEIRLIVTPPSLISQPQDLLREGRGIRFYHGKSAGGSFLSVLSCLSVLSESEPFRDVCFIYNCPDNATSMVSLTLAEWLCNRAL